MAVRRCRCGYTTDDVFADGCPLCLRPMALVNAAGPAAADPARSPFRRALPFLAVGLVIATLIGVLGFSGRFKKPPAPPPVATAPPDLKADSTGRIRVGMHVGRVAKELDPVIVRNEPGKTLEDMLPRDSEASGILVCRKGRRQLLMPFSKGYVTGVLESPAPAGQDDWAEVAFRATPPHQPGPP